MNKSEKFLKISEMFLSLQGEGLHSGLPCFFIRIAGCDLRCKWCDTPEAQPASSGEWKSLQDILQTIPEFVSLIQITGGEPLLFSEKINTLSKQLIDAPQNKKVLLETGGHRTLNGLHEKIHIIMDIKLPGSGENNHDFSLNFPFLKTTDEIKFIVCNRLDFDIALDWISSYSLTDVCNILFSPVRGVLNTETLAEWILESELMVRLQIQLHKVIWGDNARGV